MRRWFTYEKWDGLFVSGEEMVCFCHKMFFVSADEMVFQQGGDGLFVSGKEIVGLLVVRILSTLWLD